MFSYMESPQKKKKKSYQIHPRKNWLFMQKYIIVNELPFMDELKL